MLTCLPVSLCSWNYRIVGAHAGEAGITFNRMSQQGTINYAGHQYQVVKQSLLMGKWTLESAGSVAGHAVKTPLLRQFEIQTSGDPVIVDGKFLSGLYRIVTRGTQAGTIRKMHPFTRRAVVECDQTVSELDQMFAFWLVALSWRNASRESA